MRLAGICFLAFACLSACDELQPRIVWEGQARISQNAFLSCLERSAAFGSVHKLPEGAAVRARIDHEVYAIDGKHELRFGIRDGRNLSVKVHSTKALAAAQVSALRSCARRENSIGLM